MNPTPLPNYIGGEARLSGRFLDVRDAWSGDVAWRVSLADADDVDAAITAAVGARRAMAALAADQRRDILLACVAGFEQRRDVLAQTLCVEAGKPIRDARGEVQRLIDTFTVAATEAMRDPGDVLELATSARTRGMRGFTKRVPVGVCSFITPFNFPLNLVAHKIAPAIAAGCPFVLKPADKTPVSALHVAEVLAKTGLPEGAFSILVCDTDVAAPLVEDPRIALFSFTGGPIGWDLKARAGRKKVTLELGGNAACIVDADPGVPMDILVERLMVGGYYQSGQSCISVQRLYVHASVYPTLRKRLIAAVQDLRQGNPKRETTFIGPMINEDAAQRLDAWMDEAEAMGAQALVRGKRRRNRLPPALYENVPRKARLHAQEAFGPVMLMAPFRDFDAALAQVNDSAYGLQAGVFTARIDHAMRAWDVLEVGGVVIGDVPSIRVDAMPYGGVKASGMGREGLRAAIDDMSDTRLLLLKDR